ncbi:exo-alpha-sialidase [Myxococcota bacterium]|nr:exo-alpha-sialidase [Myxococcota bacterium]
MRLTLSIVLLLAQTACADPRGGQAPPPEPLPDRAEGPPSGPSKSGGKAKVKSGGKAEIAPDASAMRYGMAFNNTNGLARTSDGALHFVYADGRNLLYERRPKGGEATLQTLATNAPRLMGVASDGGTGLVVVWSAGAPPTLYAAMSEDAGARWTAPEAISTGPGEGPTVMAWRARDGLQAAAAWSTPLRDGDQRKASVWATLLKGGEWSAPVEVSSGDDRSVWVALGGDSDDLYAVWRAAPLTDETWTLTMSKLGRGDRWSAPRSLGIEGHDPSLCIDDRGGLHLGYHHELKAYRTASTDGGETWSTPVELGQGLFVRAQCGPKGEVVFDYVRFLRPGRFTDDSIKTVELVISTDYGRSYKTIDPTGGRAGQTRPVTLLNPDGTVELRSLDMSGDEPKLEGVKVTPR